MIEFRAAAAMGRRVRGRALVAKDGFSARYDLDRVRGVFSRPDHRLAGQSYVGRILVLDAAKGGVATAWMLHEMTARGVMPAALVLNRVNPIMVQGAAFADFTMVSGFDVDITDVVPDGALVEVDPESTRPACGSCPNMTRMDAKRRKKKRKEEKEKKAKELPSPCGRGLGEGAARGPTAPSPQPPPARGGGVTTPATTPPSDKPTPNTRQRRESQPATTQ